MADQIEPLVQWLNENMQNIVSLLNGQLSKTNMAEEYIQVKGSAGIRNAVSTAKKIDNVSVSRVVGTALHTGFNWWPTQAGFEFAVTYSTGNESNIILKVEYNV